MLCCSSIGGGRGAWARKEMPSMTAAGWIMMTAVLLGVWGGFVYLLVQTSKRDRE